MDYTSLNTFVENEMYKTIIQNCEIIIGKVTLLMDFVNYYRLD